MALTVGALRRATLELHDAREVVTISALSSKLGFTPRQVRSFVDSVNGLREELRIYSARDFVALMYVDAADCLRLKGEGVTYIALARELGLPRQTVRSAFERHPDWAVYMWLSSPVDAKRKERKHVYSAAVSELRRKKIKRSRWAVAKECGYVLNLVLRDFKRDPTLWDLLKD
ncbi:hypothetical protein A2763_02245 [Candidatus Kaiserbacteria bacterium RIFCSPHIGHO2_01_FULL_54_36]|uniref:Uncharacterized protein n=1 Tax=Candidatus Kaiserbacteria bacterium RIFCSPHIGHO2_01_FULL_54_36 TaxID=1798482 RepID=A0A1F6CNF0_9BACT|nr:MAG: hypothetical protein A2763_02245 [Candidatus Kaiserbacteria bacterium RIFCSPHIGHO2_01_FULL_54_36]OGG75982.1 MAG: hypothetical protein A3A41_03350 [Candidatus Kaiserbacteria bacterium RIFCSPLOWO2_01_FULL_54_22]